MTEARRVLLLCCRQSGKSTTAGTLAMWQAAYRPKQMILMGAPSQNQSSELLLKARSAMYLARPKILDLNTGIDRHNLHNAVTRMRLANRSRIVVLPGRSDTVRGYSAVDLLIVDEAAYVPDDFYRAVFPMMAVSQGRMMLMSTPHAKVGTFYELWEHAPTWKDGIPAEEQPDAWLKVRVTWHDCPRITQAFVDEYRTTYGEPAYMREFECEFQDSTAAVFRTEDIEAMVDPAVPTWELL